MIRHTRFILAGLSDIARQAVLPATHRAFISAEVIEVGELEAAEKIAVSNFRDLLVLADPDSETVARAIQTTGASGMPRWAVVVLGRGPADLVEVVPPDEWNPPLLARVFRAAVLQHELLHESLRLRGDLRTIARRVSHDLFTPIGCIGTSTHVLKTLPPDDASASAIMIENIQDSSEEIFQLVKRTSFLVRASVDPYAPTRVAMGEVVAAVLKQLEPEIQNSGGTISSPSSWPEATGVSAWLHVIWWNLLANAFKHGGPVPEVKIGWSNGNGEFLFWVTDRGRGVAPELQPRLFETFDRLHAVHKPGIGLNIVQRLVALQNGRCGYERLPENLSRFFFTLPADRISLAEQATVALQPEI